MRGGGDGEGGGVAGEDGTLCGGPRGMPIGRRRSRGGVQLRPVSGIRGEGGGVLLMGTVASGAPVLVLEAVGCGRRAKICSARFILRHAVAAISSIFSSSACLAIRKFCKLSDREFAAKVAFKNRRKSNVTVAGKIKVCAVVDARGT